MQNNRRLEKHKLQIKVISPVHIGSGEKVQAKEYFYDEHKGEILFPRQSEWHRFIYEKKLLAKYTDYMQGRSTDYMQGRSSDNLTEWLSKQGFRLDAVREFIASSMRVEMRLDRKSANDIAPHIKQVDGSVYIPGSSIKGYLRTAILHHLLLQERALADGAWRDIKEKIFNSDKNTLKKSLESIVAGLEQKLLHRLGKSPKGAGDAVNSVMQGLLVGDALPVGEVRTVLLQKMDLKKKDMNERSFAQLLPIFRECIAPGMRLECEVTLDYELLKLIGIRSYVDLQKIADEFYDFILERWQRVFTENDEAAKAFANCQGGNMFLGGGTGFLTKTILAAIAPNEEEELETVRKLLDTLFSNKGHRGDRIIAPRTLKLVSYQRHNYLQGIVEVKAHE